MQITAIDKFQFASVVSKDDFILSRIRNKKVLDIGCVNGSMDIFENHHSQWLHGKIKDTASFVLGIDILEEEVRTLQQKGFNIQVADATKFTSNEKYDTIVCGDIIEHLANPGDLLACCSQNMKEDGELIICTPNPFASTRFMNIFCDGSTPVHTEHTMWFDPQTLIQLANRYGFELKYFSWLTTDYPCLTTHRYFKWLANKFSKFAVCKNHRFATDFGMIFCKKNNGTVPKFSVIIPTYNRPDMVINTISDMLNQVYNQAYEIIIIDNNSIKENQNILLHFLQHLETSIPIQMIVEHRRGLVFARHTGAVYAQYDHLFFCDDDGRYEPNCLSALAEVYCCSPSTQAVGTKIEIEWDEKPQAIAKEHEYELGKIDYEKTFSSQCIYINGGSFSIKKDLLYRVKGFNPGQLGKYIYGNSETGLCEKLFSLFVSIGFTDKTTMRHVQFSQKNGTLRDLLRRRYNNGVSMSYSTFVSPIATEITLNNIKYFGITWIKSLIRLIVKAALNQRKIFLEEAFLLCGYVYGFWRYSFKIFFLKLIKKKERHDYILSENYTIKESTVLFKR